VTVRDEWSLAGGGYSLIGCSACLRWLFRGEESALALSRLPSYSTIAIEGTTPRLLLYALTTVSQLVYDIRHGPFYTHRPTARGQQLSHSTSISSPTPIHLRNTVPPTITRLKDTLRWSPQPPTPPSRDANCRGRLRLPWSSQSSNGSSLMKSFCKRPRYSMGCQQRKNAR
jgi:hypothetical protein